MNLQVLEKYKPFLGKRYPTLAAAIKKLSGGNNIIVELGAARSFVNDRAAGCMSDDPVFWDENHPENWDWGAGIFTRVCAELIAGTGNILHSVDPSPEALKISRIMTEKTNAGIFFHHETSTGFLSKFSGKINLLYMDHHETSEETARLHLDDIKIVLEKGLLAENALVLIDDVILENPFIFPYGKGHYSIPYLKNHGFEPVITRYQMLLERKSP